MLRPILCAALLARLFTLHAQLNITQVGHLDYQDLRNSDLSNIWGYVDEQGHEYALVGVNGAGGNTGGLSVVDVTDPANPQEVFFTPGPTSIWREIKVWGDHAYMTTEAEQGLTIVDLTPLPQSTDLPVTIFQGQDWETAHSLFIDENGRLYLNGANRGNGGIIFYDLTLDPMAPVEVGEYDQWYVHDCFARGDTLYAAHISDGFFSIVDVSDPTDPQILGSQITPGVFTHNCWLDDTGNYLFTTDEVPNSVLASYDVSDPTDIVPLDELQTNPGSNAIIHNTYWLNDYVVQSYYTEGVSIYDVSDPSNVVEVGHFDTSPLSGEGFNGAWGVYPFAPSGNLYVSDIEQGLFILAPQYVQACAVQGLITNASTTAPVNGASISIVGTATSDQTGFDGLYSMGLAVAGTYSLSVSAPGYLDQMVSGVVLANGQVTVQDVALVPLTQFALSGQVIEEGTSQPVPFAPVNFHNEDFDLNITADANGLFGIPDLYTGTYDVTAGHWGHHTTCLTDVLCTEGMAPLTLTLPVGYADDFAMELGWSTSFADAETGEWERGIPEGTELNGDPAAPGADVDDDCGEQAYVTGNGGGQAGSDDVDNGYVELRSPLFDLTGMTDPWVQYYRWWFNGGGNDTPDDALIIRLDNGNVVVDLEVISGEVPDMGEWVLAQFSISDVITPTSEMRFIVRTADQENSGHLVEAALDRFEILPASPFAHVADASKPASIEVFPVPNDGSFIVSTSATEGMMSVLDASGREVLRSRSMVNGRTPITLDVVSGIYTVRVVAGDGSVHTARVAIDR